MLYVILYIYSTTLQREILYLTAIVASYITNLTCNFETLLYVE